MNNSFEKSLIYTGLYKEIIPYLNGKDLIHLLLMNKYIYDEKYIQKYLYKKSSYIIRLFKKYHTLNSFIRIEYDKIQYINHLQYRQFIDCKLARKYQAMLYYSFYLKKYRNDWYNKQLGWKKEIIDIYIKKHTDTPTKYDLYILIKDMPVHVSNLIGW
jgi:hypothetical protein